MVVASVNSYSPEKILLSVFPDYVPLGMAVVAEPGRTAHASVVTAGQIKFVKRPELSGSGDSARSHHGLLRLSERES